MATTKATSRTDESPSGFTDEERAAMKERAAEVRSGKRRGTKASPEEELLAKIAELSDEDRVLAERLHAVIMATASDLSPKTWYGMPAWARDGKIICFFQPAAKFKSRYATFGFNDDAMLDDGDLWPTAFALTNWTPAVQKKITALVRKATNSG